MSDDALITLKQAAQLPLLGGHFNDRALYRAAKAKRLQASTPSGRTIFTTRQWVQNWIETSCPRPRTTDAASPPDSGTTPPRTGGSSSTAPPASTRAIAMAMAERLSRR